MDNNNPDPWDAFRQPANADETLPGDDAVLPDTTILQESPYASDIPAPAQAQPTSPPLFPYATSDAVAEQEPDPAPKPRRWLGPLLGGLAGATLLAGVLWVAGVFDSTGTAAPTGQASSILEIASSGGQSIPTAVAKKVVPSIVTVDVGRTVDSEFLPFASGSGVVLTADGLIVTNHHVVDDAERVQVIFGDGRIYEAEVVGSDRRTDLAVLRIATSGLTPIELGSTTSTEIGEIAIAVGSPLGLEGGPSLTVGVISAFGRQVRTGPDPVDTLFDMLQTDAPITQGSSGGALVDGQGRLLGITSAIGVSGAGAEGIGFAIPTELMTRITDEIIETGDVAHAFLGVELEIAFEEVEDGAVIPAGVYVERFATDPSAAATAGVQQGDLIVGYNNIRVATGDDLISGLRRLRVGDIVTLSILRDSAEIEIDVVLGTRPEDI